MKKEFIENIKTAIKNKSPYMLMESDLNDVIANEIEKHEMSQWCSPNDNPKEEGEYLVVFYSILTNANKYAICSWYNVWFGINPQKIIAYRKLPKYVENK